MAEVKNENRDAEPTFRQKQAIGLALVDELVGAMTRYETSEIISDLKSDDDATKKARLDEILGRRS